MKKIVISAGEVSGDIHAAKLISAVLALDPSIKVLGMGSERLRDLLGNNIRYDLSRQSIVGLFEGLKHLPAALNALLKMRRLIKKERPDLLVLVDSQGFNMPLAGYAKKLGIPTLYYIAPQEWLWGTPKNQRKVVGTIDHIIAIFRQEQEIYSALGGNVRFFGHPILDQAIPSREKSAAMKFFDLDPASPVIGLFPGSRRQEIDRLLPLVLESARLIVADLPKTQFLLAVSSAIFKAEIMRQVKRSALPIKVYDKLNYDIMQVSDLIIATSGTTLLEAACLKIPAVTFYKFHPLTYLVAKAVLKNRLRYFAMPNILAGKQVIPELAQAAATADRIAFEAKKMLENPEYHAKIVAELKRVSASLGEPGATGKSAAYIIELLGGKKS